MRLPGGLRAQSGWIFIGTMCALAGLSYLVGLAGTSTVSETLGPIWVRAWGGFLFLSGILVAGSTWVGNRPLERMSLRFLSLGLMIYTGWLLAVLPLGRASLTVSTTLALISLSEIRVAVLTMALRPLPPMPPSPSTPPQEGVQ